MDVNIHLHICTPSVHVGMYICMNIHAEFACGGVYICIFVWRVYMVCIYIHIRTQRSHVCVCIFTDMHTEFTCAYSIPNFTCVYGHICIFEHTLYMCEAVVCACTYTVCAYRYMHTYV